MLLVSRCSWMDVCLDMLAVRIMHPIENEKDEESACK
jgi:hypothetical protein